MSNNLQSLLKQKINENIQAHTISENDFAELNLYQTNKLEQISLDKISVNQSQPRIIFDDELLDSLAKSIQEIGLLQPITVRPKDGNNFEIVSGERRFRAFQKLGRNTIDCIIIRANEEQNILLALAENLSRENLSDYEVAKAILKFKTYFPSKTKYAKALGLSRQKLYKLLAFESLDQEILTKLDNNPTIISSDIAEQVVALKKQLNISDELFTNLITEGLDLIQTSNLKQSKLSDYIKNKFTASNRLQSPTKSNVKKIYKKNGKSIGRIKQTENKYIIEIDNLILAEDEFQKVEDFFDQLLGTKF